MSQYHAAAVVDMDGQDTVTMETFAGTGQTSADPMTYTIGTAASFHDYWTGEYYTRRYPGVTMKTVVLSAARAAGRRRAHNGRPTRTSPHPGDRANPPVQPVQPRPPNFGQPRQAAAKEDVRVGAGRDATDSRAKGSPRAATSTPVRFRDLSSGFAGGSSSVVAASGCCLVAPTPGGPVQQSGHGHGWWVEDGDE